MMLATIMIDAYTAKECDEVAAAINRICNPPGQKSFSRVGVYAYWEYETRDLLYIGLTGNQAKRFGQHNGLIECEANCCKREQIQSHLKNHERIGISLFLQSKLQDDGSLEAFDDWTLEESVGFCDSLKNASFAEGQLLQAHVEHHGKLPPWNGNRAGKEGHGSPSPLRGSWLISGMQESISGNKLEYPFNPLTDLSGMSLSPLVARYTLREVPGVFRNEASEDMMHGVRMYMLMHSVRYEEAAMRHKEAGNREILEILEAENYLGRIPKVFVLS